MSAEIPLSSRDNYRNLNNTVFVIFDFIVGTLKNNNGTTNNEDNDHSINGDSNNNRNVFKSSFSINIGVLIVIITS